MTLSGLSRLSFSDAQAGSRQEAVIGYDRRLEGSVCETTGIHFRIGIVALLRTGIWVLRCWINPPDPK